MSQWEKNWTSVRVFCLKKSKVWSNFFWVKRLAIPLWWSSRRKNINAICNEKMMKSDHDFRAFQIGENWTHRQRVVTSEQTSWAIYYHLECCWLQIAQDEETLRQRHRINMVRLIMDATGQYSSDM